MTLSRRFSHFSPADVKRDVSTGLSAPCPSVPEGFTGILTSGYCYYCCVVRDGRRAFAGHGGLRLSDIYPTTVEDATVRRPDSGHDDNDGAFDPSPCSLLADRPLVSEYLVSGTYDDGTPRELSTIKFGVYQGRMRVSLDDHDLKQSVYSVGDSITECLDLLEGALRSDAVRWYRWGAHKVKKK